MCSNETMEPCTSSVEVSEVPQSVKSRESLTRANRGRDRALMCSLLRAQLRELPMLQHDFSPELDARLLLGRQEVDAYDGGNQ
jgi:hypothetical protein